MGNDLSQTSAAILLTARFTGRKWLAAHAFEIRFERPPGFGFTAGQKIKLVSGGIDHKNNPNVAKAGEEPNHFWNNRWFIQDTRLEFEIDLTHISIGEVFSIFLCHIGDNSLAVLVRMV